MYLLAVSDAARVAQFEMQERLRCAAAWAPFTPSQAIQALARCLGDSRAGRGPSGGRPARSPRGLGDKAGQRGSDRREGSGCSQELGSRAALPALMECCRLNTGARCALSGMGMELSHGKRQVCGSVCFNSNCKHGRRCRPVARIHGFVCNKLTMTRKTRSFRALVTSVTVLERED